MFSKSHKNDATVSLRIPSRIEYIRKASDSVLRDLARHHPDEEKAFDIKLCVEEAVRNAIVHGNRSDKQLSVNISWRLSGKKVVIEVEDEGAGFDHNSVPDPTSDANMTKNCGRGVFLIRKLMDKVEYNESGNKIRMIKKLM